MAVKRYIAEADNTITNAHTSDLASANRATGSNMGESDILETFSIFGQSSGSSGLTSELSRILVKFPVSDILTDRNNDVIPASGSVGFVLKLSNAKHSQTLPRSFTLEVAPISQSWEEGYGLDMEEYTDKTYDGVGSNWINRSSGSTWGTIGGKYHDSPRFKQTFTRGYEDLELNITHLVEQWIDGEDTGTGAAQRKLNYGVGIYLTASEEAFAAKRTANVTIQNLTGAVRSYYTKKFFARGSEFFFKRPYIEARWDSATKDNGGNFYYSSSLAPAAENLNTLYFYNYVRGQLKDIPTLNKGKMLVSLYSGSSNNTAPSGSKLKLNVGGDVATNLHLNATGGAVDSETGIYSCSLAITGATQIPLSTLFVVWHSGSHGSSGNANDTQYHTASVKPIVLKAYSANPPVQNYVTTTTNLKPSYHKKENARFRFHTREKNWNPNIYTKARSEVSSSTIEDAYYRIYRVSDNYTIINYGTGSTTSPQTKGANVSGSFSRLSYDVSGSYFDLDMSMLEPDFAYGIKLIYYVNGAFAEQPEDFKFRVEES